MNICIECQHHNEIKYKRGYIFSAVTIDASIHICTSDKAAQIAKDWVTGKQPDRLTCKIVREAMEDPAHCIYFESK